MLEPLEKPSFPMPAKFDRQSYRNTYFFLFFSSRFDTCLPNRETFDHIIKVKFGQKICWCKMVSSSKVIKIV